MTRPVTKMAPMGTISMFERSSDRPSCEDREIGDRQDQGCTETRGRDHGQQCRVQEILVASRCARVAHHGGVAWGRLDSGLGETLPGVHRVATPPPVGVVRPVLVGGNPSRYREMQRTFLRCSSICRKVQMPEVLHAPDASVTVPLPSHAESRRLATGSHDQGSCRIFVTLPMVRGRRRPLTVRNSPSDPDLI
jgi:hypothetical protein